MNEAFTMLPTAAVLAPDVGMALLEAVGWAGSLVVVAAIGVLILTSLLAYLSGDGPAGRPRSALR